MLDFNPPAVGANCAPEGTINNSKKQIMHVRRLQRPLSGGHRRFRPDCNGNPRLAAAILRKTERVDSNPVKNSWSVSASSFQMIRSRFPFETTLFIDNLLVPEQP